MKVLIAFLLCALMQTYCVAVLNENTGNTKQVPEMIRDAFNDCIREMNRDPRYINNVDSVDPCISQDPNMVLCVNKKTGLMNEAGIYNVDRLLSFSETAEERQIVLDRFNGKMKECSSPAGGDPCKLVACMYRLPESLCGRVPNEDDGC